MYYVYILKDSKVDNLYYGYTDNLKQHIFEHKIKRNMELIYYEACRSERDAYNREMRLRNYTIASTALKSRLKASLRQPAD